MDEPITRVPFSVQEEHTVASMARWMRFMGAVGIVGGMLMLFLLVAGIGFYSVAHVIGSPSTSSALSRVLDEVGAWIWLVALAFAAVIAVTLWQNFTLFHAGDDFHLVAATDTADVDYLARGLDRLRTFFMVQVLAVVVTLVLVFGTAIVVFALMRRAA